jgi:chromosomal replication initiation ATPase DnaA
MQPSSLHKNAIQEKIITAVCEHFNVTEEQLLQSKSFDVAYMRWICFYLTKKNTFLSAREIGERFKLTVKPVQTGIENVICRKKIYAQTMRSLKEIAEKAGILDF